jgi:hypothetical protein
MHPGCRQLPLPEHPVGVFVHALNKHDLCIPLRFMWPLVEQRARAAYLARA